MAKLLSHGGRAVIRVVGAGLVGLLAALYYTGTPPFDGLPSVGGAGGGDAADAGATAARLAFWLVAGAAAGLVGNGGAGLLALWIGVLGGHLAGLLLAGADQNTVLLYLLLTLLGAVLFVTPGYVAGWFLAGRLAPPPPPDGSALRPAPPPLRGDVPEPEPRPQARQDPLATGRGGAAVPLTRVRPGRGDGESRESGGR